MPTVSHSWNASRPMACVGTCPVMITIGIESMYAVAIPVTALVTPGPEVTSATPTLLLERERSEEHTSELQSLRHLVCRLLLEKKKLIMHLIPSLTFLLV